MNTFLNLDRCPASGRYILRLNASLLKGGDCSRHILYKAFYGLSKSSDMWKADYGSAVHRALQSYYGNRRLTGKEHGQVVSDARAAGLAYYADVFVPEDDWRNTAHLSATLNSYFKEYATDELEVELLNDVPQLEKTFEILYYEDDQVIVYLVGTIDMRGAWQEQKVIVDTKVTGNFMYVNKPDKWLESFQLSLPLALYKWAMEKETGDNSYQCMINGLLIKKTGVTFQRRLFEFSEEHVESTMRWIGRKVKELVENLKWLTEPDAMARKISHPFEKNTTQCNNNFGCAYAPLCLANNPMHEAELITSTFDRKMYDPRRLQEEI